MRSWTGTAIDEFQVVRPIFVVAPNLIPADKTSRESAESAVRSVLRCHKLCDIGRPSPYFDHLSVELQTEKDSMAERVGFELPVPGEMSEIAALERLHAI